MNLRSAVANVQLAGFYIIDSESVCFIYNTLKQSIIRFGLQNCKNKFWKDIEDWILATLSCHIVLSMVSY